MMTLGEWFFRTGTKRSDFARRVGCSSPHITRLARDQIKPGLCLALRIERETEGKVPVSIWHPEESGNIAAN